MRQWYWWLYYHLLELTAYTPGKSVFSVARQPSDLLVDNFALWLFVQLDPTTVEFSIVIRLIYP